MKKKLYLFLLAIATCFILTACDSDEKKAVQMETYERENTNNVEIQDDSLKLTVEGETSQVVVTDLKTNKVYRSNPTAEDIQKYANAKGQYKDILSATLDLKYSDSKNNEKEIDNYSNSIVDGRYKIEKVSNNEVVVNYSIGEIEKTYACPLVIKESRMNELLKKMSQSEQTAVKRRYYSYYNYEELAGESGDEAQLEKALTLFPNLKDEPVYYLPEDITDAKLKNCEKYFVKAGYTIEDRAKDMEGYNVSRNDGKPVFDISVHYVIENGQLVVKVPMKDIKYNPDYPLVELQVLPNMGTANKEEEGYSIVPEGTGGIIRFNNGKTGQQKYLSNVYGWDYGLARTMIIDEEDSQYPVFSMVNTKTKSSFLCVSEEGSSYATVASDISGKNNGYNYTTFAYQMLHGENYDVGTKSDTTVRIYEDGLPDETISQRYIFSQETEYPKMAEIFRNYLTAKYPELTKKETSTVPFAVEMIGAVDNTEHILGYPVVRPLALTSYEQAKMLLEDLQKEGIKNINAKYTGWFNNGVNQKTAASVDTVGRLGSESDLKDLTLYSEKTEGINLFLNGMFSFVYKDEWFDGFSSSSDAAKFCSREEAELYEKDPVTYQANEDFHYYNTYYLLKPKQTIDNISHYADVINNEYGCKNVGFEDIGHSLSADYNPKDRVSREKTLNLQRDKMKALNESGKGLMITGGNLYAVPYADFITDMNIDTKKVNIVDETIPFYQMALHGLVDYSSTAINLSEDEEENILKSAETGAGLYFTYIYEPTDKLQDTEYTKYYACNYKQWKNDTINLYNKFKDSMGDLYNQFIVNHEMVAKGVYKTTYENGNSVLVNYNYSDYNYQGTVVPKRDFTVVKGGGQ